MADDPRKILETAYERASRNLDAPIISNSEILQEIDYLIRGSFNKAGARYIVACALAKIHNPSFDIRKPYTEIGTADAYSGRNVYDDNYVGNFIKDFKLPLNETTAWLTPGFRVRFEPITRDVEIHGRPKKMYVAVAHLLDDVFQGVITAEDLLAEMIRQLIIVREERRLRMESLKSELESAKGESSLSVDEIVGLISHHLQQKNSSRLPVLVVAAAYQVAKDHLGEQVLPLESHNAADKQTRSLGDLEITLIDDSQVITSYEMKKKRVVKLDIDHAITKIASSDKRIDNYIFITTEDIDPEVSEYASMMFNETGVEFTILDCLTFLKYFLYLFYRLRVGFLEAYQELVLAEPESAVSQPLKEVFLALRHAAESGGE